MNKTTSMNKTMSKRRVVGWAAGLAIAGAAAMPAAVAMAEPNNPPAASEQQRTQRVDALATAIAEQNGLDKSKVVQAINEVRAESGVKRVEVKRPPRDGKTDGAKRVRPVNGEFAGKLATKLGIDQAKVTSAIDSVRGK